MLLKKSLKQRRRGRELKKYNTIHSKILKLRKCVCFMFQIKCCTYHTTHNADDVERCDDDDVGDKCIEINKHTNISCTKKRFKFTLDSPLCKTIQTKADPLTFTITLKCQFIYILFNISAFALSHQHHCHPPPQISDKTRGTLFLCFI